MKNKFSSFTKLLAFSGLLGLMAGIAPSAQAQNVVGQGTSAFVYVSKGITKDTRWTRDKVYVLTRMIFVSNNATLTIEPGTIIRGVKKGAGPRNNEVANEPGTLIISRTGKIVANGTPDDPIIMTSIDDPNVPGGIATVPKSFTTPVTKIKKIIAPRNYSPSGPLSTNGFAYCEEFGGLVILGRALVSQGTGLTQVNRPFNDSGLTTGSSDFKGADIIEGLNATFVPGTSGPNGAKLGAYGGTLDNDNSGVVRFVSIRYAGDVIGESNELNSLTVGGLGDSTVLEHIESTFNTDDGFEWFGGKNNSRFLYSLYNRDDAFDGDEGARIIGQFWTAVQGSDSASRSGYADNNSITGHSTNSSPGAAAVSYNQLMEWDGPEPDGTVAFPATTRVDLWNYTFIGRGSLGGNSERGIRFRLRSEGYLNNGVVEVLAGSTAGGISTSSTTTASYKLEVNNLHYHTAGLNAPAVSAVDGSGFATSSNSFTAKTGEVGEANSQVVSKLPYTNEGGMDFRLAANADARTEDGPLPTSAPTNTYDGIIPVNYAGSSRDNTHLNGWSNLVPLGVLPVAHPTRLVTSLGLAGNNVAVSFQFNGRSAPAVDYPLDAIFVIEVSVNGKVWTPVKVVKDGDAADTNAAAGSITIEDTISGALPDGVSRQYRAFAL